MEENGGRDIDYDDKCGWWCQGDGSVMRNHKKEKKRKKTQGGGGLGGGE